jgi:ATP phosphoribosyltransferase regulatory subunit
MPELKLTLDPLEFRGFRYHTGVCVTVFAPGRHEELGRGGRYLCGDCEPATGLTLYPDAILRAAPQSAVRPRAFVPRGAAGAAAARAAGFATVAALDDAEALAAARAQGCTHLLMNGVPVPLDVSR